MTNLSIHPILFLESPVVQICVFDQLLLVSNYTKCILCNTETEEFKQIGNQPRDGRFGACFVTSPQSESIQSARIFCARPGVRMWECALDGSVIQTHKFKSALKSCRFVSLLDQTEEEKVPSAQLMDQLFSLQPIQSRFVIAQSETSFFIFDMVQSTAFAWNDELGPIQSVKVVEDKGADTIVVFSKGGHVVELQFMRLESFFVDLVENQEAFVAAACFLLDHLEYFKQHFAKPKAIPHYKAMIERLDGDCDAKTLVKKLRTEFDELIKSCAQSSEADERNIRLESGMYVIDNSCARSTYANVLAQNNEPESVSEDEAIVDEAVVKVKSSRMQHINTNPFTENDRMLQNLFFVYKSLKMSNLSLVDRYAEVFDRYDIEGISDLLGQLERLIVENEREMDASEAKQYCARMFLNYFKPELFPELNEASVDFVIESFIVSNRNERSEKATARCLSCRFPLVVDVTTLRYKAIGESVVKYLWLHDQKQRCMDIVSAVPAALAIILRMLLNEAFGATAQGDWSARNAVTRTLFACGDKKQLKQAIDAYPWLRSTEFWSDFLDRLHDLRADQRIVCIKCGEENEMKLKFNVAKSFYTYDFAFNSCAECLSGLSALQLCRKYSQHIPSDALTKNFYLKCLLNS